MNSFLESTSSTATPSRLVAVRADAGSVRYGSATQCRAYFQFRMAGTFSTTIFSPALSRTSAQSSQCWHDRGGRSSLLAGSKPKRLKITKWDCSLTLSRVPTAFLGNYIGDYTFHR